jgi:hypothetical protein
MTYQFTEDEKKRIISSLKALAVAQAEFWDVLRDLELEHEEGLEIETDVYLVGELAGDCSMCPRHSDLQNEAVWDSFVEHSHVEQSEVSNG